MNEKDQEIRLNDKMCAIKLSEPEFGNLGKGLM